MPNVGKKGLKWAVTRLSKQSILVLLCCGGNLLTELNFFLKEHPYICIYETFILWKNLQKSSSFIMIYPTCLCPSFTFCFFTTSRPWTYTELDCNHTEKQNITSALSRAKFWFLNFHSKVAIDRGVLLLFNKESLSNQAQIWRPTLCWFTLQTNFL